MLGFMPLSAAPMSSLGLAIVMAGSAGAYATTGQEAGWDRSVVSEAGVYALTGKDAELDPSLFFRCQTGDFYITGGAASFSRSIPSEAGAYQTTGQAAVLRYGQVLEADAGAYAVTGQPVIFRVGASIPGDLGTFTLTGQNVAGRYVLRADAAALGSASPQWPLASQPMSSLGPAQPSAVGFLLQSTGTSLQLSRLSGAGSYILTGYPVRFLKGPYFRIRGRDRSGPYVLAMDRSGGYVVVRDFSEGLP